MTMRTRVRADGKVDVPVPEQLAVAGTEVDVTVERVSGSPSTMTAQDKLRILNETAGSIPDFPYVLAPALDPIPPLDID
ncbi:hypothetical protein BH09PLA1_BH09PLA1_28060 [soil metagenome]